MATGLLQQLTAADAWGVMIAISLFGALGSAVHAVTSAEPTSARKVILVGVVASLGLAAFKTPTSAIELVGVSALAGLLARSVLAGVESRTDLAIALRQADRALVIAGEAIELTRRRGVSGLAHETDIGKLSARLDEIKASRPAPESKG